MRANLHLIIGGARSGKSRHAEQHAEALLNSGKISRLIFVATAQAKDREMKIRIAHHIQNRSQHWKVIEEPWDIAPIIEHIEPGTCLLLDCLTLWLTYGLCEVNKKVFSDAKTKLLQALDVTRGHVIIVSNEVGHGIVPFGALSRQFVDESGWLNQVLAARANKVEFMMAGLPLTLKEEKL